jgi:cytochrome c-type biogenesis protein CcmH
MCRPAVTLLLMLFTLWLAQVATAQDNPPANLVTADEVNAVARDMYCPVCENIPLDVCPTAACQQWREEIRTQLEEGQTPDQIKTSFVARYGDRVVGTPQDPTLRALSLVTPWLVAVIAILVAITTVVRWRRNRPAASAASLVGTSASMTDDDYRARLEQDLLARR